MLLCICIYMYVYIVLVIYLLSYHAECTQCTCINCLLHTLSQCTPNVCVVCLCRDATLLNRRMENIREVEGERNKHSSVVMLEERLSYLTESQTHTNRFVMCVHVQCTISYMVNNSNR